VAVDFQEGVGAEAGDAENQPLMSAQRETSGVLKTPEVLLFQTLSMNRSAGSSR